MCYCNTIINKVNQYCKESFNLSKFPNPPFTTLTGLQETVQEQRISTVTSHMKESVQIYEEEEQKYIAEEKDFVKEKVFDSTHISDDEDETETKEVLEPEV